MLYLIIPITAISQYGYYYRDIGNTRLADSIGKFSIGAVPGKSLSEMTIRQNIDFRGSVDMTNATDILIGSVSVSDGASIDSLNADNITTGTLLDDRLSSNVALRDETNILTDYTQLGNTGISIKQKLIRGKIVTAGAYLDMPHGLEDYRKIRGFNFTLLRDTTGTTQRVLNIGYNASVPLAVGFVLLSDTTNIKYYVSATSTALVGDSVRILLTYEK